MPTEDKQQARGSAGGHGERGTKTWTTLDDDAWSVCSSSSALSKATSIVSSAGSVVSSASRSRHVSAASAAKKNIRKRAAAASARSRQASTSSSVASNMSPSDEEERRDDESSAEGPETSRDCRDDDSSREIFQSKCDSIAENELPGDQWTETCPGVETATANSARPTDSVSDDDSQPSSLHQPRISFEQPVSSSTSMLIVKTSPIITGLHQHGQAVISPSNMTSTTMLTDEMSGTQSRSTSKKNKKATTEMAPRSMTQKKTTSKNPKMISLGSDIESSSSTDCGGASISGETTSTMDSNNDSSCSTITTSVSSSSFRIKRMREQNRCLLEKARKRMGEAIGSKSGTSDGKEDNNSASHASRQQAIVEDLKAKNSQLEYENGRLKRELDAALKKTLMLLPAENDDGDSNVIDELKSKNSQLESEAEQLKDDVESLKNLIIEGNGMGTVAGAENDSYNRHLETPSEIRFVELEASIAGSGASSNESKTKSNKNEEICKLQELQDSHTVNCMKETKALGCQNESQTAPTLDIRGIHYVENGINVELPKNILRLPPFHSEIQLFRIRSLEDRLIEQNKEFSARESQYRELSKQALKDVQIATRQKNVLQKENKVLKLKRRLHVGLGQDRIVKLESDVEFLEKRNLRLDSHSTVQRKVISKLRDKIDDLRSVNTHLDASNTVKSLHVGIVQDRVCKLEANNAMLEIQCLRVNGVSIEQTNAISTMKHEIDNLKCMNKKLEQEKENLSSERHAILEESRQGHFQLRDLENQLEESKTTESLLREELASHKQMLGQDTSRGPDSNSGKPEQRTINRKLTEETPISSFSQVSVASLARIRGVLKSMVSEMKKREVGGKSAGTNIPNPTLESSDSLLEEPGLGRWCSEDVSDSEESDIPLELDELQRELESLWIAFQSKSFDSSVDTMFYSNKKVQKMLPVVCSVNSQDTSAASIASSITGERSLSSTLNSTSPRIYPVDSSGLKSDVFSGIEDDDIESVDPIFEIKPCTEIEDDHIVELKKPRSSPQQAHMDGLQGDVARISSTLSTASDTSRSSVKSMLSTGSYVLKSDQSDAHTEKSESMLQIAASSDTEAKNCQGIDGDNGEASIPTIVEELDKAKEELAVLHFELEELRQVSRELDRERDILGDDRDRLTKQLKAQSISIQSIQNDLEHSEARETALREELTKLQSQQPTNASIIAANCLEIKEVRRLNKCLDQTNKQLHMEKESILMQAIRESEAVTDLEISVKEANLREVSLKKELETLRVEASQQKEKISHLVADLDEATNQAGLLWKSRESLIIQSRLQVDKVAGLERHVDELISRESILRHGRESMMNRVAEQEGNFQQEIAEAAFREKHLRQELDFARREVERTKDHAAAMENEISALHSSLSSSRNRAAEATMEVDILKDTVNRLDDEKRRIASRCDAAEQEMMSKTKLAEVLEARLEEALQLNSTIQRKLDQASDDLEDAHNEIEDLNVKSKELQMDIETHKEDRETAREMIQLLGWEMTGIRETNRTLLASKEGLDEKIRTLVNKEEKYLKDLAVLDAKLKGSLSRESAMRKNMEEYCRELSSLRSKAGKYAEEMEGSLSHSKEELRVSKGLIQSMSSEMSQLRMLLLALEEEAERARNAKHDMELEVQQHRNTLYNAHAAFKKKLEEIFTREAHLRRQVRQWKETADSERLSRQQAPSKGVPYAADNQSPRAGTGNDSCRGTACEEAGEVCGKSPLARGSISPNEPKTSLVNAISTVNNLVKVLFPGAGARSDLMSSPATQVNTDGSETKNAGNELVETNQENDSTITKVNEGAVQPEIALNGLSKVPGPQPDMIASAANLERDDLERLRIQILKSLSLCQLEQTVNEVPTDKMVKEISELRKANNDLRAQLDLGTSGSVTIVTRRSIREGAPRIQATTGSNDLQDGAANQNKCLETAQHCIAALAEKIEELAILNKTLMEEKKASIRLSRKAASDVQSNANHRSKLDCNNADIDSNSCTDDTLQPYESRNHGCVEFLGHGVIGPQRPIVAHSYGVAVSCSFIDGTRYTMARLLNNANSMHFAAKDFHILLGLYGGHTLNETQATLVFFPFGSASRSSRERFPMHFAYGGPLHRGFSQTNFQSGMIQPSQELPTICRDMFFGKLLAGAHPAAELKAITERQGSFLHQQCTHSIHENSLSSWPRILFESSVAGHESATSDYYPHIDQNALFKRKIALLEKMSLQSTKRESELEKKISGATEQIATAERKAETLQEQADANREHLCELEVANRELKRLNRKLEEKICGIIEERHRALEKVDLAEGKLSSAHAEIQTIRKEVDKKAELLSRLESNLESSQHYSGLLSSAKKDLEATCRALKEENKTSKGMRMELAAQLLQSKEQAMHSEELVDVLKNRLLNTESELEKAKLDAMEEKQQLEEAIVKLQMKTASKQLEMENLLNEYNGMKHEVAHLSYERRVLQEEVDNLQSKIPSQAAKLLEKEQLLALKDRARVAETQLYETRNEQSSLIVQLSELQERHRSLVDKNMITRKEKDDLQEQVAALKSNLRDACEQQLSIASVERALQDEKALWDNKMHKMDHDHNVIKSELQNKILQQDNDLKELISREMAVRKQLSIAESERAAVSRKVDEIEMSRQTLAKRLSIITLDRDECRQKHERLGRELAEINKERAALEEKVAALEEMMLTTIVESCDFSSLLCQEKCSGEDLKDVPYANHTSCHKVFSEENEDQVLSEENDSLAVANNGEISSFEKSKSQSTEGDEDPLATLKRRANRRLKQLKDGKRKVEKELENTRELVGVTEVKLKQREAEVDDLQNQISILEGQSAGMAVREERLENELTNVRIELRLQEGKVKELTECLGIKKEELAEAAVREEEIRKQTRTSKEELERFKSIAEDNIRKLTDYFRVHKEQSGEAMSRARLREQELRSQFEQASRQLKEAFNECEILNRRLSEAALRESHLEVLLSTLKIEEDSVQCGTNELKSKLQRVSHELEAANEDKKILEFQLSEASVREVALEGHVSKSKLEMESVINEARGLRELLNEQKQLTAAGLSRNAMLRQKLSLAESELESMKSGTDHRTSKLKERNEELQMKSAEAQAQQVALQKELLKTKAKLEKAMNSTSEMRGRFYNLGVQQKKARASVREHMLQKALMKVTSQLEVFRSEVEAGSNKTKKQLKRLHKDLESICCRSAVAVNPTSAEGEMIEGRDGMNQIIGQLYESVRNVRLVVRGERKSKQKASVAARHARKEMKNMEQSLLTQQKELASTCQCIESLADELEELRKENSNLSRKQKHGVVVGLIQHKRIECLENQARFRGIKPTYSSMGCGRSSSVVDELSGVESASVDTSITGMGPNGPVATIVDATIDFKEAGGDEEMPSQSMQEVEEMICCEEAAVWCEASADEDCEVSPCSTRQLIKSGVAADEKQADDSLHSAAASEMDSITPHLFETDPETSQIEECDDLSCPIIVLSDDDASPTFETLEDTKRSYVFPKTEKDDKLNKQGNEVWNLLHNLKSSHSKLSKKLEQFKETKKWSPEDDEDLFLVPLLPSPATSFDGNEKEEEENNIIEVVDRMATATHIYNQNHQQQEFQLALVGGHRFFFSAFYDSLKDYLLTASEAQQVAMGAALFVMMTVWENIVFPC